MFLRHWTVQHAPSRERNAAQQDSILQPQQFSSCLKSRYPARFKKQTAISLYALARRPSAHSAKAVTGCEWPHHWPSRTIWHGGILRYILYQSSEGIEHLPGKSCQISGYQKGMLQQCSPFPLTWPKLGQSGGAVPYKIHRTVESAGSNNLTSWPGGKTWPFWPLQSDYTWRFGCTSILMNLFNWQY